MYGWVLVNIMNRNTPSVSNTIVNIAWDREDMLFILVEVVIRLVFPCT